jgi:crotonobetainyl-CoA:carnitine CoA-transferase CaiB-like acyl-CoA transferase
MTHAAFGDYWRLPPKLTFAGVKPSEKPAAWLGEHSRSLLNELGYEDDIVQKLIADEVVFAWSPAESDAQ